MSDNDFERGSDQGMSDISSHAIMNNLSVDPDLNKLYHEFVLATPVKVQCYKMFEKEAVIVDGPEYLLDLSYWLVHEHPDLKLLERGILVSELANDIAQNKVRHQSEFRILQRMTQHKDHISNLFVSSSVEFSRLNKHRDVLPYQQNRVILKSQPKLCSQDLQSWNFYVNASKINSSVRKEGVAYIAAQLPSQHSVGNFWQMIWEGNIEQIVMIIKDIDEEYPYWSDQTNKMREDDCIKVVRLKEETLPEPGLIRRVIWISDGETEKEVEQLNIFAWEDNNVVTPEYLATLDSLVDRSLQLRKK